MTDIEWTDKTWNPVTGCTKVSAGCKNCYAETVANRFWGERKFTDVQTHPDRLDAPLRWRKPRRVFVNSMSDLFHEDVPDEFIDRVFAVMALSPQYTFQVLTKRPVRMRSYCRTLGRHHESDRVSIAAKSLGGSFRWTLGACGWHLPNVWLGVSVENQAAAEERIPLLLQTPAAVRFLSCEPLLGPVKLCRGCPGCSAGDCGVLCNDGISWVIVGGESGPCARPCDVAWIRSIVEQCRAAKVACFMKQLGAKPIARDRWDMSEERFADLDASEDGWSEADGPVVLRLRDRKGGDQSEWPEYLRVREFPR